jgi:hypothetical protein
MNLRSQVVQDLDAKLNGMNELSGMTSLKLQMLIKRERLRWNL